MRAWAHAGGEGLQRRVQHVLTRQEETNNKQREMFPEIP